MLRREYGQTNTLMSIMTATKITLNMWIWGTFQNKSAVIANWENVWMNSYVQMYKSLGTKQPYFVLKRNAIEKKTPEIFDWT